MGTPFLGMLVMYGLNFQPRGWAFCDGRLLSIANDSALFALIGTYYGGDGQTTFALPDLRGRVPIGVGQGPGLSNRVMAEMAGNENVTLLATQIPSHNHSFAVNNTDATVVAPIANVNFSKPIDINKDITMVYNAINPTIALHSNTVSNSTGNQPHNNMMPYLTLNYCIALEGIFPSRN
jgi:microcystin-dependent protein